MPIHCHRAAALALTLLGALVAGCGATEESGSGAYSGPYDYAEVELEPGLLAVGQVGQARLIAYTESGVRLGWLEARWAGDDDAVATIDSSGWITVHADGFLTLTTDVAAHPARSVVYVSPAAACGEALDVDQWWLQGGLGWNGSAAAGDSSVVTHHAANWSLFTGPPRQVDAGTVSWRIGHVTIPFTRRDTLTVGATARADQGDALPYDSIPWWGEVRLTLAGCKLGVSYAPVTRDVVTLVRPGQPDSLIDTAWRSHMISTGAVAVGTIGTGPLVVGGALPLMLPTEADLPFGYAPSGYAAFVASWRGEGADSVAVVQNLTPSFTVVELARHR